MADTCSLSTQVRASQGVSACGNGVPRQVQHLQMCHQQLLLGLFLLQPAIPESSDTNETKQKLHLHLSLAADLAKMQEKQLICRFSSKGGHVLKQTRAAMIQQTCASASSSASTSSSVASD